MHDSNQKTSDKPGGIQIAISNCNSASVCKKPTEFFWSPQGSPSFSTQPDFQYRVDGNHERVYGGHQYADINGDGRLDFMWLVANYDNDWELRDLSYKNVLSKSNENGEPDGYSAPEIAFFKTWKGGTPWEWKLIDYNGDGRSDFATFNHYTKRWDIYLSRYDSLTDSWKIDSSVDPIVTVISEGDATFQDVNGDGLLDAVSYRARGSWQPDHVRYYYLTVDENAVSAAAPYYFSEPVDVQTSAPPRGDTHRMEAFGGQSGDFNGDGHVDVVYQQASVVITSSVKPAFRDYIINSRIVFSLGDVSGDGEEDVFYSLDLEEERKDYQVGVDAKEVKLPEGRDLLGLKVSDLNNDGYSDIVAASLSEETNTVKWYVRFSTGYEFTEPVYFMDTGKSLSSFLNRVDAYQPLLVDLNGDGYSDFVWHDTDENKFKVNYWSVGVNNFLSSYFVFFDSPQGNTKDRYQLFDMDGDSVADLVYFDGYERSYLSFYFNRNSSPTTPLLERINSGLGNVTEIEYGAAGLDGHYLYRGVSAANGAYRNHCLTQQEGVFSSLCDEYVSLTEDDFYDDLYSKEIFQLNDDDHSFGLDGNRDGAPEPVFVLNSMGNVVTSVSSSSPAGQGPEGQAGSVSANAKSKVSYFYADAKYQAMGRGWLGFGALITRDEQTKIITATKYRQDYPFVGKPLETKTFTAFGHLLSSAENWWGLHRWDGGMAGDTAQYSLPFFQPHLRKSIETSYGLAMEGASQGGRLKTVTTETSRDASGYGNIPRVKVTVEAEAGAYGVYTTITDNTYGSGSYNRRYGRLKSVKVTHRHTARDEVIRNSSFTYYQSGEQGGSEGMLKTETVEEGTPFERTTQYGYDKFGNKVRSKVVATDPTGLGGMVARCDVDTVKFDGTGRYVDVTRDCTGRKITEVTLRDKFGSPKRVRNYIDTSGSSYVEAQYVYTGGGVNYFQTDGSGSFEATTVELCANGCGQNAAFYTRHWGPGNSATPARVELAREYVDVLGRPIKKLTRGFDGTWIHQDIEYDSLGRVQRKSVPYYHGSEPEGWTTLTYDILGRVVSTVHPDGSSQSTDYNGFVTTYTNAKGQVKKETHNALGELVSVEDNLGTKVYYGYDAQGNLETTRHDNGTSGQGDDTVIAMEYDLLGRKTSMNDPDKGVWTYQYNAFGELETQTNAKGQTSTILYDGLGRKLSREDRLAGGQLAGQTTWVYDGPNGLGQLAHVADSISGYVKVVEYDNLGRPSKTVTSLGVDGEFGNHYEKVTYDQYGRAYQVFDAARNDDSYTDNGIEYRYNQYGYQHQVVDAVYNNGVTRKVYHTISGMDAWGNVTGETLGSGVAVRQKEYDGQTGRLKIVRASNASKTVQELEHEWDAIGNLESVHDTGTGGANTARNWLTSYGYDSLNRLTSTQWKKNGSVIRSDATTYYRNGNIKTKSRVGTYVYDRSCGCGPHAVTQAGNTTYQYDANGNMVRDSSGRKIAYTTFDKAYRMERGSTQVSFAYDTSRKRYLRTDTDSAGTQTTLYIGSVEKITHKDGSKQWKRYIGGNLMILQDVSGAGAITQSHTRYLLKDHLGSLQYILDAGGFVVQSLGFDPWGDRLNSFQNEGSKPWATDLYNILETTRGFTGHEMVDGLDIVHMNGRIYDSRIGRFLQADIIIDGANNTQGYNRYSYVHNNPLNATDPSGHFLVTLATIAAYAVSGKLTITAVVAGIVAFGQAAYYNAGVGDALIAGVSAAALTYWGIELAPGVNPGFSQAAMYGLKMGVIGGMTSILQGGNFGHGFVSAGVGSGIGAKIGGFSKGATWTNVGKAIGKMTLSGTISKVTGGKFANGAAAVAFAAIVSSAAQRASDFNGPSTGEFVEAGGVSSEDAAKGADLNVSPGEFVEGSRDYSAPRAAPYSSQGVIEEVVVRAQYTGARLAPLTYYINPTITSRQYVDRQMNALNRRLGTIVEYGSYALMPGTAIGGVRVISQAWKAAPLQQRRALVQGGVQLLKALSRNEMKGGSGLPTYEPIPYRAGVVEVTRDIGSF